MTMRFDSGIASPFRGWRNARRFRKLQLLRLSRIVFWMTLYLAVDIACTAVHPVPANADPPEQWVLERSWGDYGGDPGQFDDIYDVLVTNGRVYVSDYGNDRIQVFDTAGEYLFSWGRFGSGAGEFNRPIGLATDENGILYVTDQQNCRLQMFALDGRFLDAWPSRCGNAPGELGSPIHVEVRSGDVYVVAHACPSIEKFRVDGGHIWEVPCGPGRYFGVVLSEDGTLWAAMNDPAYVRHFTPSGELLGEWPAVPQGSYNPWPQGLEIDTDGNIYVANEVESQIDKYSPGGEYIESIAVPAPVALDIVDDRELYVATGWVNSVYKFVRVPVPVEDSTWGRVKSLFR